MRVLPSSQKTLVSLLGLWITTPVYKNKTSSKKDQGSWIIVVNRALWIRLPKQHCSWSQQINFKTSDRNHWTPHFSSQGSLKLLSLDRRDEVFIFECFEQQKENYLLQERDKNFIRNNNTLEKASCNILAPVSFGEKHLLEKAEALITKHQDILERNFKTF